MNKLRILPSAFVCGFLPSGHKEPRVTKLMKWLITLLFLWPAFASAVCSPGQTCVVTSGTVVVSGGPPVPLNFAGRDFSASGVLIDIPGNLPFGLSFSSESDGFVASFFGIAGAADQNPNLVPFELTVNGVPWGIPAGSDAVFGFSADLGIPAPAGTYNVPFAFEGHFNGTPEPFSSGLGCDVLNCVNLEFRGSGIVTYDVQGGPIDFFVSSPLTFTFANVPEPATLSLFALGLVGLATRRKAIVP